MGVCSNVPENYIYGFHLIGFTTLYSEQRLLPFIHKMSLFLSWFEFSEVDYVIYKVHRMTKLFSLLLLGRGMTDIWCSSVSPSSNFMHQCSVGWIWTWSLAIGFEVYGFWICHRTQLLVLVTGFTLKYSYMFNEIPDTSSMWSKQKLLVSSEPIAKYSLSAFVLRKTYGPICYVAGSYICLSVLEPLL